MPIRQDLILLAMSFVKANHQLLRCLVASDHKASGRRSVSSPPTETASNSVHAHIVQG